MQNLGFNSTVLVANTAGVQIGTVGAQAASDAAKAAMQGVLHTINVGSDTTAATISVYDGTSTSGTLRFKGVVPSGWSECFILDIQLNTGLFVVLSGGTTPNVTLTWD